MNALQVPERSTLMHWTMGIAIFVFSSILGLALWEGSNRPASSTNQSSPVFMQNSAPVLPDRAVLLSIPAGDVTLYVPCCSFGVGGTVTMVEREANLFAEPVGLQTWSRPRVVNVEFSNPGGEQVDHATSSTAVEVCFLLNEDQWYQYERAPGNFEIQAYENQVRPYLWKSLATTAYAPRHSLCAQTNRLTLFALATRDLSMPVTGRHEPYRP